MSDSLPIAATALDYHGKYVIADLYRDGIVAPIIERQKLDIDPNDILVLLDDNSTSTARLCAQISLLPEIISDIVYQLTGRRFFLLLKLSQAYMRTIEPARVAYYVYDALRHIERDEKGKYIINREHDICVWREILPYVAQCKAVPNVSEVRIYEVGARAD